MFKPAGKTALVLAGGGSLGADRLVVLPTGFACALPAPPSGAAAQGLHALTLLIAHQIVRDLVQLAGTIEVFTVPSPCPVATSPVDFSQTENLIARSAAQTRTWLASGGLQRPEVPKALLAHSH